LYIWFYQHIYAYLFMHIYVCTYVSILINIQYYSICTNNCCRILYIYIYTCTHKYWTKRTELILFQYVTFPCTIYVYRYLYACMNIDTYVYINIDGKQHSWLLLREISVYSLFHTNIVCIYVSMYNTYSYVYIYLHVYIYVFIHIYVHTYIRAYIYR